jgi:hypothetical protein
MNPRLAALDTIAACLRVSKTSEQASAIGRLLDSGQIDWEEVIKLANATLVSPALWAELCSLGLQGRLPAEVQDYLGEIHRLNTQRNLRLCDQVIETVQTLNSIDVVPILLKGAASLFTKTYLDPGSRILTDIDILVPHQVAEDCWNLLCTQGYAPHVNENGQVNPHALHHLEPLSRPGDSAVIEIHHAVLPPLNSGRIFGASLTANDAAQFTQMMNESAELIPITGLSLAAPSATARVLHCLLHSAFYESNAHRSGALPLRSIHELALLQSLFSTTIDWHAISRFMAEDGKSTVLRSWVYLAHRLFGCPMPNGWTTTAKMLIHYARCRLQARWGLSITLLQLTRTTAH